MADAIGAHLSYLYRLREAMSKKPDLQKDGFFTLVENAYRETHILWVHAHYLSCSGAGRTSEKGMKKAKAALTMDHERRASAGLGREVPDFDEIAASRGQGFAVGRKS